MSTPPTIEALTEEIERLRALVTETRASADAATQERADLAAAEIDRLTQETTRLARLGFAWSCLARGLIRRRDATTDYDRKAAAVDIATAEDELRAMGVKP